MAVFRAAFLWHYNPDGALLVPALTHWLTAIALMVANGVPLQLIFLIFRLTIKV